VAVLFSIGQRGVRTARWLEQFDHKRFAAFEFAD
jgi:hypothetical protein